MTKEEKIANYKTRLKKMEARKTDFKFPGVYKKVMRQLRKLDKE